MTREYFSTFYEIVNIDVLSISRSPLQNVQFCSSSRKARILTTGIYWIFRGLKFETDAEIGQKGTLCKGLSRPIWGMDSDPDGMGA
jgi:hypothetical protein